MFLDKTQRRLFLVDRVVLAMRDSRRAMHSFESLYSQQT
jgi:hypothetical protein